MFGEGISRSGEIIDLGVELGIIKKSGSWFSYNDTKIAQGRDAAKAVMIDNPELADEIEEKIMEQLNASSGNGSANSAAGTSAPATSTADTDAAELPSDDLDFDSDLDSDDDFTLEDL
jgi:hypothetical protein